MVFLVFSGWFFCFVFGFLGDFLWVLFLVLFFGLWVVFFFLQKEVGKNVMVLIKFYY